MLLLKTRSTVSLTCIARPTTSAWMAVASWSCGMPSRMPWQVNTLRRPRVHMVMPAPRRQSRCLAQQAPCRRAPSRNELEMRAKSVACSRPERHEIPERLIIYHAGMGRVAFLALLKLTSLLLSAFVALLVVPSYVMAEKPMVQTAAVALASIAPILFISYTTAPLVTHIHFHLPPVARTSQAALERFVGAMPASSRLTLTTMSVIAKPRYSSVTVGDLRPVQGRRFGLVNYVRDTGVENATRKWYMYRAVGSFYVQQGGSGGGKGKQKQKRYGRTGKVDGWIWDAVTEKALKR